MKNTYLYFIDYNTMKNHKLTTIFLSEAYTFNFVNYDDIRLRYIFDRENSTAVYDFGIISAFLKLNKTYYYEQKQEKMDGLTKSLN